MRRYQVSIMSSRARVRANPLYIFVLQIKAIFINTITPISSTIVDRFFTMGGALLSRNKAPFVGHIQS